MTAPPRLNWHCALNSSIIIILLLPRWEFSPMDRQDSVLQHDDPDLA